MLGLFNTIVLLLVIHVVLYKVSGFKSPGILSCGLFAYISSRDRNRFNWDKFNALGIDNDERGGDSIGRAVGDDIRKFVSKKATTTYKDYVINHKNGHGYHIALGHTRKASVGAVSEETAQPIVIELPDGQGKFIMVHNGTLYNWEDLAKKYNIEKTGKTDSMVLGEIICEHGYGVLLEYTGAAALIIRDDREPDTLKVFRGASKNYSHKVEDERPLYYYEHGATSMYISSREEGLFFIGGDVDSVFEFDPNILYTIHNGRIISREIYDRSACSQVRVWGSTTNNSYTTKHYTRTTYIDDSYDAAYSDWNNDYNYTQTQRQEQSTALKEYNIKEEKITRNHSLQKIIAARFRYYFMDYKGVPHLATGPINMDKYGFRNDGKKEEGEKTYYFYAGIMLTDKQAFYDVKKMFGKSSRFIDSDENICKIVLYSQHPICTIEHSKQTFSNIRYYRAEYNHIRLKNELKSCFYSGTFTMLFGKKQYKVVAGTCRDITELQVCRAAVHETAKPVIQLPTLFDKENSKVVVSGFAPNPNSAQEKIEDKTNVHKTAGSEDEKTIADKMIEVEIDLQDQDRDIDYSEDVPTNDLPFDLTDEEKEMNRYAEKSMEDGIQAMLMALDEAISGVETVGASTREVNTILANLYKMQDILLDNEKLKTSNLIAGYDEF